MGNKGRVISVAIGLFVAVSGVAVSGQDAPVNSPLPVFPQNALANVQLSPQAAHAPLRLEVINLGVDRRPRSLSYIYAGYAALQIGDAITTTTGLSGGARGKNPLMSGVASSPLTLGLIKLGATAATVYAAESLWRNGHRKGAIIAMIAATAITGMVVANNMRVLSQQVK